MRFVSSKLLGELNREHTPLEVVVTRQERLETQVMNFLNSNLCSHEVIVLETLKVFQHHVFTVVFYVKVVWHETFDMISKACTEADLSKI